MRLRSFSETSSSPSLISSSISHGSKFSNKPLLLELSSLYLSNIGITLLCLGSGHKRKVNIHRGQRAVKSEISKGLTSVMGVESLYDNKRNNQNSINTSLNGMLSISSVYIKFKVNINNIKRGGLDIRATILPKSFTTPANQYKISEKISAW